MARPENVFPEVTRADSGAAVLTVSSRNPSGDRLRAILHDRKFLTLEAHSVMDALRHLRRRHVFLVIVDGDLPDGSWRDLLTEAERVEQPPLVVVTAVHADEQLWGEVLNLGGYDVLVQPFNESEVERTTGSAMLQWQEQLEGNAGGSAGARWAMHALSA